MNRTKAARKGLCFLLFILMASGGCSWLVEGAEKKDKFLIIHLDAVSSLDFFQELEGGFLPNIAQLFAPGQQVRYGLSLFPGGTEMIYPRLKQGLDNSQGDTVGWGHVERERGYTVGSSTIFLELLSNLSRRNRHQFLYGAPFLTNFAGLSLLNLERLWETQDAVEFFWFNTDAIGHLLGTKAHRNSMRLLDRYLGLAMKGGVLAGKNIVIYCDHGMSTEEIQTVPATRVIRSVVGKELNFLSYPNLYLHDPSKKAYLARRLAEETPLDLTFVCSALDLVQGFVQGGQMEIVKREDKYAYYFTGRDYFGYGDLGLEGCFLTRDEWLEETKDHFYPAVPPNIFLFLSNPLAGDIVFVFDPPKIVFTPFLTQGHHSGLRNTDLLVPLLFVGPAFADLEPLEQFWLNELYSKHLHMIDFSTRHREQHLLRLSFPFRAELSFSPAYRWRGGLLLEKETVQPWVEYDLYSSFLTRVWVGLAFVEQQFKPQLKVEAFLGSLGLTWLKRSGTEGILSSNIKVREEIELHLGRGRVGFSFLF